VVVVTLALGMGANSAMFTVVNTVLLRPLPFPEPDRLVMIYETNLSKGWTRLYPSPANFVDWREASRSFEGLAAFRTWFYTLSGDVECIYPTGSILRR
jgi:putative ABC transport system permease protein